MQAGSKKNREIGQGGELSAAAAEQSCQCFEPSVAQGVLEPEYLLRLFFTYPPQGFAAEYAQIFPDMPAEPQEAKQANAAAGAIGAAAVTESAAESGAVTAGGQTVKSETAAAGSFNLPLFSCRFNLLTTLEPLLLKKLQKLFFYPLLQKLLSFRTLFVGATVSEFAPLPPQFSSFQIKQAADYLLRKSKTYLLVIVKDLPQEANALVPASQAETAQNFTQALQKHGFISVKGQALAYVPIDFADIEAYLARFSKARRKNFRRKLRAEKVLTIEILRKGDSAFADETQIDIYYRLYENVYAQSAVHFDFLSKDFFRALLQQADDSLRFITYRNPSGQLIGYNICFVLGNKLVDKYIGLDYPAATDYSLYFVSWFYNLAYAKRQNLDYYIAGWTDPEVKAALGAKFVMTRHAVYIRNPLLRRVLTLLRPLFESDARQPAVENPAKRQAV